jgi:hypothetical protein
MSYKFIDDGQPEASDFDDNYVEINATHHSNAPATTARREWRELKLPKSAPRIVAPKDVRFFQWMEDEDRAPSNNWKFGFLGRIFG